MKKTFIFLAITILITITLSSQKEISDSKNDRFQVSEEMLSCKYYDEMRFRDSLNLISDITVKTEQIKGGIVPHHLLADDMIAEFFKIVSVRQPETVILIGPNHIGAGTSKIHTSKWNWSTPFGVLEIDDEIVSYLIEGNIAETNFELMENDHSISALVPYVKYFMPETKLIPLLVTGTDSIEEAEQLGKLLGSLAKDKENLIIASIDFSHYLSLEQANNNDKITKQALENRNIKQISTMNNDYMDSPASIITVLSAMNEIEAYNQEEVSHSNSAIISGQGRDYTTSYFTYIFY